MLFSYYRALDAFIVKKKKKTNTKSLLPGLSLHKPGIQIHILGFQIPLTERRVPNLSKLN